MALLSQTAITIKNEISRTDVTIIHITEDKLINILHSYIGKLKKPRDVAGAIALFVTLLGTLLTASFNDTRLASADMWKGVFVMLLLASAIYLGWVLLNYFKYRCGIDDIMRDIKKEDK